MTQAADGNSCVELWRRTMFGVDTAQAYLSSSTSVVMHVNEEAVGRMNGLDCCGTVLNITFRS